MRTDEVSRIVAALERARPAPFGGVPDEPGYWYAVWVDAAGAEELRAIAPEPVPAGIVYVGECVTQSLRRHLAHSDIGSLTLMKNLAALFREPWRLTAENRGGRLRQPGRGRLLDWMDDHLSATWTPRVAGVRTRTILSRMDPPLRLQGWGPELSTLRQHIKHQRAELDGNR